jgi:hypothetical protein
VFSLETCEQVAARRRLLSVCDKHSDPVLIEGFLAGELAQTTAKGHQHLRIVLDYGADRTSVRLVYSRKTQVDDVADG